MNDVNATNERDGAPSEHYRYSNSILQRMVLLLLLLLLTVNEETPSH
jgi:hypothetical protein